MLNAIKRKVELLTALVLLQAAALAGLGAFVYIADARAKSAMTEIAAIRHDLSEAKDASQTARDYGRMAAALGPPCPAEERPGAQRRG